MLGVTGMSDSYLQPKQSQAKRCLIGYNGAKMKGTEESEKPGAEGT